MAKVVASRAPRDEALQERLERAAARFSSIHDRWAAAGSTDFLASPAGESAAAAEPASQGALALPVSESGVCVTPILGVATAKDDDVRPRFKTLMGVPRNDPDVDVLAGLRPPHERAPDGSDAAQPKRTTPPPLPERFLAMDGAAPPQPVAAADDRATRPTLPPQLLPPQAVRTAPPQRAVVAQGTPDVAVTGVAVTGGAAENLAAELAAVRRSQRRRSWLVGIGSFVATLLVFAVAAPRERTLALRWLRDEYRSRIQPIQMTVADTARALKPGVVEPARNAGPAQSVEGARAEAEQVRNEAAAPGTGSLPDPAIDVAAATAATAMEVAREPASGPARPGQVERSSLERAQQAALPSDPSHGDADGNDADGNDVNDSDLDEKAAPPPRSVGAKRATREQPKAQVAAPRKRSTRVSANKAGGADSKPRAARATKERSPRQNSPRRDSSGGIIRETPF